MNMTPAQADDLAGRIVRSWPRTLSQNAYAEQLADFPHGPAHAAINRLIRDDEHPPSIARLRATIRSLITPDHAERRATGCGTCGGDGWETVHLPTCGDPTATPVCLCNRARPCRCAAGGDNKDTHRRLVAANRAELNRLGIGAA